MQPVQPAKKPHRHLYAQVLAAITIGILLGSLVPKLELSSLYTSEFKLVIPAWMPESSAMDGNLATAQALD